jgi:hypothetical protein
MDFEDFLRDGVELDETVRVLSEAPYNVALAARTWRSKVSRKPTYMDVSEMKKRYLSTWLSSADRFTWERIECWIEHGI